ncbi:hypothetical protein HPB50_005253 [Hyalomma asiaticum]|uniref:Uncharacterized protein n=1 Tax=Hyalomma asiaticum TaxID=266040 RepID=A0ACB7T3G3_HYAAI|nr:hypothetical protein HPB50_005253 [Hyalomma asiaticum]
MAPPARSRGRPAESEEEKPGAREGCRESVLQNQHGCGTVSAVRIRVSTFSAIWHDRGPFRGAVPARAGRLRRYPPDHGVPRAAASTHDRRRASAITARARDCFLLLLLPLLSEERRC